MKTIHFNHRPGDGLHYVNDNARSFPDGSTQLGDTSYLSILLNLETILAHSRSTLSVPDLWNTAYPDDFMSDVDFGFIIVTAVTNTDRFDPSSPDNITAVIDDLRSMGCDELADVAIDHFRSAGLPV